MAYWLTAIKQDARYFLTATRQASTTARFLELRAGHARTAEGLALAA